jgi:DNA-binding MarR family transcriptional regulator
MADETREQDVERILASLAGWCRVLSAARTRPFGDHPLSRTQVDTLFLVAHGRSPVTPGDLARALGITAGGVTQLIDGLRMADLVVQTADPADARRRVITLTPAAARRLRTFERHMVRALAPRFADLPDPDLGHLADLLERTKDIR